MKTTTRHILLMSVVWALLSIPVIGLISHYKAWEVILCVFIFAAMCSAVVIGCCAVSGACERREQEERNGR